MAPKTMKATKPTKAAKKAHHPMKGKRAVPKAAKKARHRGLLQVQSWSDGCFLFFQATPQAPREGGVGGRCGALAFGVVARSREGWH